MVAGSDYAVNFDRAGSDKISRGCEGKNQRLRSGIDYDKGLAVFELDGISLLVRGQERAIDQDSIGDEVEAPVPSTLEHTCHHRTGRRLLGHP